MREVNFSIPNVNKASVGITTALYDRRALDCTSTLPLINSLNYLAYLTTSSARIRDILTVDGGIERLVCILKEGRSKDMMEMWKWNLAFQCVVNIGVRGSEAVRTRVVEADMVPVIATILDNYIKVVDKCREKADADAKQRHQPSPNPKQAQPTHHHHHHHSHSHHASRSRDVRATFLNRSERGISNPEHRSFRRQHAPPALDFFPPQDTETPPRPPRSPRPRFNTHQPPTTNPTSTGFHQPHRSVDATPTPPLPSMAVHPPSVPQQPLTALPPITGTEGGLGVRAVRDLDRLPSMVPGVPSGLASQPESPTTPTPPANLRTTSAPSARHSSHATRSSRRRPSIRHSRSISGESDDANGEDMTPPEEPSGSDDARNEPIVDIRAGGDLEAIDERDSLLEAVDPPLGLTGPNASDTPDAETFRSLGRTSPTGTASPQPTGTPITTATGTHTAAATAGLSPTQAAAAAAAAAATATTIPPVLPPAQPPRSITAGVATGNILPAMPRDEDILLSLQLLAYVSKYCNLRSYFQRSHLVPKLQIGNEINLLDDDPAVQAQTAPHMTEEEMEEEYLIPNDFNIFPLVEKFTPRHHPAEMHTWAGVVMRNLCRKDDSRGGIRQCAYYQCGKWEEYTRQFAKCRRCRRTKYCSKECQKSAWVFHRHWCVAAPQ